MKDTGKMIYNMEKGWKLGLMDPGIRAIIRKERNMERVLIYGVMVLNTLESGLIIK